MNSPVEPTREIPTWTVALLVIGFILMFIGSLASVTVDIIGMIIIAAVAILAYMSQGRAAGLSGLSAPALHRDLAKTHCGSCGASMRSNMTFCPVCGAQQTVT